MRSGGELRDRFAAFAVGVTAADPVSSCCSRGSGIEIGGGMCRLLLSDRWAYGSLRDEEEREKLLREPPREPRGHFLRLSISALSLHLSMTWK